MPIIKIDMHFCRQMANVAQYPDHVAPVRPVGSGGILQRLHAAWLVLTGKADALIWPGDE